MARRFVRIDLSDTARDFRPVALEPGVPLLDKPLGNAKILFRWLGGLVAEPEWDGESINFYVRDEHGGRIEDASCQLASVQDLQGVLHGDVEAVRERLGKVKPATATERAVYKIICAQFLDLVDNPNRLDRDNYFFRYRDVQGRWRLVWCWGYQRITQQPAVPVVCTEGNCNLLFVRRPGESAKCPGCAAQVPLTPVPHQPAKARRLARVLFLVLGVLLVYWLLARIQLEVTPDRWAGPVGERVAFRVTTPGVFGLGRRDVTSEVEISSDNPRVMRIEGAEGVAVAAAPGQTRLRFVLGKTATSATVTVAAAARDASAVDKPAGAAKDAPDGTAKDAPTGTAKPLPEEEPTAAMPGVRPAELAIVSDQGPRVRFPMGSQFSDFRVEARYSDGMTRLVTKKAVLRAPEGAEKSPVSFDDGKLVGIRAGKTTVQAEFEGVHTTQGLDVEVLAADSLVLRDAQGKPLDAIAMRVGDRLALGAELALLRGSLDISRECAVTTMTPAVVKFDQQARALVAVAPGQSPVKFSKDPDALLLVVQVAAPADPQAAAEPVTELKLEPAEATIHPGQGLFYQVTGVRGGKRRALGPQDGVRLTIADSDVAASRGGTAVQGEQPGRTEVVARLGQQQAKAILTVASGKSEPQAIVDLLPGGRVIEGWGPDVEYFDLDGVYRLQPAQRRVGPGGEILIDAPGAMAVVQPADTLAIEPRRISLKVGQTTPRYTVSLKGADGSQRVLDVKPQSTDESILASDRQDPARFTARSLGRTQVRAVYGGREALADVTITGERFAAIRTSIGDQGDRDFQVSAEITAADADTPLEYRVYVGGKKPAGDWTPSQQAGGSRRAVVESPRLATGPASASYQLIFEARDPRDGSIQKYPYTFRLGRTIEEVKPSAKPAARK